MTAFQDEMLHQAFRAGLGALSRPGVAYTVPGADSAAQAVRLVLAAVWEPDQFPPVVPAHQLVDVLAAVPRGSDERPEEGATVIAMVGESDARSTVRLRGPGVRGEMVVRIPLSAQALAVRARCCEAPPCGVDLLVAGPGPTVRGLPRSTRVEVVA
jgi:alpha-D-ribose 1-methylphosphonate 5-triphosphate synthase subunit PhnH